MQTTVAVLLGHAASFLPEDVVRSVALLMFLAGAVILVREGLSHQQDSGEEFAEGARDATGYRAVLASFLVLFAAEWGDLSQLLTISLVARYEAPGSVFVGALGALLVVSGLAVSSAGPCCASSRCTSCTTSAPGSACSWRRSR